MALITCLKCGKRFSEHAEKCPQCGISMAEAQILIHQQAEIKRLAAERAAAERERLRKEREEQKRKQIEEDARAAKEKREKRAEWWKRNGKKVRIIVFTVILVVVAIVASLYIYKSCQTKRAIAEAETYISLGDSCVAIYRFDEARKHYANASSVTQDERTLSIVQAREKALKKASEKAYYEYVEALRKLKILLDADDNEFNQYSNECLDKMIEIFPDRSETIYYKNLRGK